DLDAGRRRSGPGDARPGQVLPAAAEPERLRAGAAPVTAGGGVLAGARGADGAGARVPDPPPRPPLPRVRADAVAAVREDGRAETAALHLPGAGHRNPPDEDGRAPRGPDRAVRVRALLSARTGGRQAGGRARRRARDRPGGAGRGADDRRAGAGQGRFGAARDGLRARRPARPRGPGTPGTAVTFVGRREPLALIRRTLAAGAGCVLVEGPAGIGKSRLLTEAARAHHV